MKTKTDTQPAGSVPALVSGAWLEVLYFGCLGQVGHYLHTKSSRSLRSESTPWGDTLDGGVIPERSTYGILYTGKKGGWTAIAAWDNSVDTRPGSHSTFVVAADISTEEILHLAREQWPEVFSRRGFPVFSNTQDEPGA